jgi:putative transcriptional regulator
MEKIGIKQTWLCERLGKSYFPKNGYFQNSHQPQLEVLFDIAKLLEVSPKSLIADYNNN